MDFFKKKIDSYILFFVIYSFIFIVFFKTLPYTLPFVLGLLFAIILQKPTKLLISKFKFKNSIATLVTVFLFFTIIILLFSIGITSLVNEAIELTKNIQNYLANNSDRIYSYVNNLQNYFDNLDPSFIGTIESNLSSFIAKTGNTTVAITKGVFSFAINFVTAIPYVIMVLLFTLLSTYFFTKDLTNAKNKFLSTLSEKNSNNLIFIFRESRKMMGNYLLSYLLIISITFCETLVGFLILDVKYAVIFSILSAFLDILPLLGIGSVYIPLAIIYFLSGNYVTTIGLIILYIIVSIARQILEPKIISSSLGIHPVSVLAAIFIGLKANGISGMIFCIFLVLFLNLFEKIKLV